MASITGVGANGADPLRTAAQRPGATVQPLNAPLDAARSDRLKAAISAGHYPVDPAKLAERLLALGLFPAEGR